MKKSGFDYAQEEIRKVLVQEYIRKNPGVREQDVVIACKEGEIVFTEISKILDDEEMRKQTGPVFLQANRMFSQLSVHCDERWQEGVHASQNCMQMIDCLHSSHFGYFSDVERYRYQNMIKRLERICASTTVHLHEAAQKLSFLQDSDIPLRSPRTKTLVFDYLLLVIDQLKILLSIYRQEIKLGDLFLEQAGKYMDVYFSDESNQAISFRISKTQNILKSFYGDPKGSAGISVQDSYEMNEQILLETKNALLEAVEILKNRLDARRKRIQEIWSSISSVQESADQLEKNRMNDQAFVTLSDLTPEEPANGFHSGNHLTSR